MINILLTFESLNNPIIIIIIIIIIIVIIIIIYSFVVCFLTC